MLKKLKIEDIDNIMNLWKEDIMNSGIPSKKQIIVNEYTAVRQKFIDNLSSTVVYTEDGVIEGFASVDNKNEEIWIIYVKPNIQKEGIGTILVENIKKRNKRLIAKINENNEIALLFFNKNGFKKIDEITDSTAKIKKDVLEWNKQENNKVSVIYFDNDIDKELISNCKNNKLKFININVKQFLKNAKAENGDINNIKSYIKLRKKIEESLKNERTLLYIDYNNYYSFLDEQIKEIVKINKVKLSIVICEPLTIENIKKSENISKIEKAYQNFKIYKIECSIDNDKNISLNQILLKRKELLIQKIEKIAESM